MSSASAKPSGSTAAAAAGGGSMGGLHESSAGGSASGAGGGGGTSPHPLYDAYAHHAHLAPSSASAGPSHRASESQTEYEAAESSSSSPGPGLVVRRPEPQKAYYDSPTPATATASASGANASASAASANQAMSSEEYARLRQAAAYAHLVPGATSTTGTTSIGATCGTSSASSTNSRYIAVPPTTLAAAAPADDAQSHISTSSSSYAPTSVTTATESSASASTSSSSSSALAPRRARRRQAGDEEDGEGEEAGEEEERQSRASTELTTPDSYLAHDDWPTSASGSGPAATIKSSGTPASSASAKMTRQNLSELQESMQRGMHISPQPQQSAQQQQTRRGYVPKEPLSPLSTETPSIATASNALHQQQQQQSPYDAVEDYYATVVGGAQEQEREEEEEEDDAEEAERNEAGSSVQRGGHAKRPGLSAQLTIRASSKQHQQQHQQNASAAATLLHPHHHLSPDTYHSSTRHGAEEEDVEEQKTSGGSGSGGGRPATLNRFNSHLTERPPSNPPSPLAPPAVVASMAGSSEAVTPAAQQRTDPLAELNGNAGSLPPSNTAATINASSSSSNSASTGKDQPSYQLRDSWRSFLPEDDPMRNPLSRLHAQHLADHAAQHHRASAGSSSLFSVNSSSSNGMRGSFGAYSVGGATSPDAVSASQSQLPWLKHDSQAVSPGEQQPQQDLVGMRTASTYSTASSASYYTGAGSTSSSRQDSFDARRNSNASQLSSLSSYSLPGPTRAAPGSLASGVTPAAAAAMAMARSSAASPSSVGTGASRGSATGGTAGTASSVMSDRDSWRSFLLDTPSSSSTTTTTSMTTTSSVMSSSSAGSGGSAISIPVTAPPAASDSSMLTSPLGTSHQVSVDGSTTAGEPKLSQHGPAYYAPPAHAAAQYYHVPPQQQQQQMQGAAQGTYDYDPSRRHASFSSFHSAPSVSTAAPAMAATQSSGQASQWSNASASGTSPGNAASSSSSGSGQRTRMMSEAMVQHRPVISHRLGSSGSASGMSSGTSAMGDESERESWPSSRIPPLPLFSYAGSSSSTSAAPITAPPMSASGSSSSSSAYYPATFIDDEPDGLEFAVDDDDGPASWPTRDGLGEPGSYVEPPHVEYSQTTTMKQEVTSPVSTSPGPGGSSYVTTTTTTTTTTTRKTSFRRATRSPSHAEEQQQGRQQPGTHVIKGGISGIRRAYSARSAEASGGLQRSASCLVSPMLPPSLPLLDRRPAPPDTDLEVETRSHAYILKSKLPGFSLDCITLAAKHHRTLHIIADAESGGHFERRITFGPDADMRKVKAQFDGEILLVSIPRRGAARRA